MNVLIIGGAGFLGANLVRRCLKEPGVRVTVMDALEPHLRASTGTLKGVWEQIRFVRGDIRNEMLLSEIIQGQEVIFNCAAQTSHPLSIQYPLLDAEINCLGNLKILESMRLLNSGARIIYTSSSTVIGKAEYLPVDESHPEDPLEIYSANKGVAEKYYHIYHRLHGLPTVVLRFANLYGPYGKGYPEFGFLNYFIDLALRDQEITIFGDGSQERNVLFVEDATEILWQAATASGLEGKSWLATSEEHLSLQEIAETVVKIFGRGRVVNVAWPETRRKIEIEKVRFSSRRLRSLVNWEPKVSFADGLKKLKAQLL